MATGANGDLLHGHNELPSNAGAGSSAAAASGVGDVVRTALNAAALQTLSMKQATGHANKHVRVYRGNLIYNIDPVIINGARSHDVSYIADTRGHGNSGYHPGTGVGAGVGGAGVGGAGVGGAGVGGAGSPTGSCCGSPTVASAAAPSTRMRPHPPTAAAPVGAAARVPRRTIDDDPPSPPLPAARAEVVPASRADAVALADTLRLALLELPTDVDESTELALWDAAFSEVVRQVWVHCNERGQLLEAIRRRYSEISSRLIRFQTKGVASLTAEADAEAAARRRAVSTVFRFARAANETKRESLAGELSDEQRLNEAMKSDLEQVIAQDCSWLRLIASDCV